jgi:hypothetical protein
MRRFIIWKMKLYFKLTAIFIGALFTASLYAQNSLVSVKCIPAKINNADGKDSTAVGDTTIHNSKEVKQTDLSDLLKRVLHCKSNKKADTASSKPSISLAPGIGYTLVSKLVVVIAGNVTFKTSPQSKISTIVLSSSFTQKKQFTFSAQSSIWSKHNTFNFVSDNRFYKYSQSTFGLGSNSNIANEDPMSYSYVRLYETVLRHVTGNLYLGGGYIIDNHWNIKNSGNFGDYTAYGAAPHTIATGFTANALLDSRDNAINPHKGSYAAAQYRDNFESLGSTSSWTSLIVDVRKYINLPAGSDNVLALWSYDWLILSGKPGYLDLPSNQWDSFSVTGRGYIQGRFRGAQMVYGEAEYRYKITRNGLLGGVFFVNAESFSAAPGTQLQGIQPAFGPGLRLKLNKTSRTNICIDYGFGRQGSNGLFINVGEIF